MEPSEARVRVPCTCGELFQGTLDGEPCLVSCPIDRFSTATANGCATRCGDKAKRAVVALDLPGSVGVIVETPLPVGRGYGTSTADIGAALFAASARAGVALDGPSACRVAVSIEPTDSTLLDGMALLDHRRGMFHEVLGRAPEIGVLVLDPGGFVDTIEFNAADRRATLVALAGDHRRAFDLLRWGLERSEPGAICEASTLSAVAHQAILPSQLVEEARAVARGSGSLGVCRAHSGTVVGVLFDPGSVDAEHVRSVAAARLRGVDISLAAVVDGGPRRVG